MSRRGLPCLLGLHPWAVVERFDSPVLYRCACGKPYQPTDRAILGTFMLALFWVPLHVEQWLARRKGRAS